MYQHKSGLATCLKNEQFINDITCTYQNIQDSQILLQVKIHLTHYGVQNRIKVAAIVMLFIEFLRNTDIQEWYWEQSKKMSEAEIEHLDSKKSMKFVTKIVTDFGVCQNKNLLINNYFLADFNETYRQHIKDQLRYLTLDNCFLVFMNNDLNFEEEKGVVDPHYEFEYSVEEFTLGFKKKYNETFNTYKNSIKFAYPDKNSLVPKNFDLILKKYIDKKLDQENHKETIQFFSEILKDFQIEKLDSESKN